MLHFIEPDVQEMWSRLKTAYDGTYAVRLCAMTLKFKTYRMDHKHIMAEHLRVMSTMIHDIKSVIKLLG